jgi:hypothetical protein
MKQQEQYVGIDFCRRRLVIVRITDDGDSSPRAFAEALDLLPPAAQPGCERRT